MLVNGPIAWKRTIIWGWTEKIWSMVHTSLHISWNMLWKSRALHLAICFELYDLDTRASAHNVHFKLALCQINERNWAKMLAMISRWNRYYISISYMGKMFETNEELHHRNTKMILNIMHHDWKLDRKCHWSCSTSKQVSVTLFNLFIAATTLPNRTYIFDLFPYSKMSRDEKWHVPFFLMHFLLLNPISPCFPPFGVISTCPVNGCKVCSSFMNNLWIDRVSIKFSSSQQRQCMLKLDMVWWWKLNDASEFMCIYMHMWHIEVFEGKNFVQHLPRALHTVHW